MIGAFLDFLRRSTGQTQAKRYSYDDEDWKRHFELILGKSDLKPRLLVDLVRKGIPDTARGWAWCQILEIGQVPLHLKSYKKELLRIFGTLEPIHYQAPCFGSPLDLSQVGLSTEGQDTVKKLMCIVGYNHPHLEFTPFIPAILAILTIHLTPDECLGCLASMIEGHAIPAHKRQDWAYFPLHRRDYLVFERVLEDLLKKFVPRVWKHITRLQLMHSEFIPDLDHLLGGLLLNILPTPLILRIFDAFLVEGYKIILRFAIAHVYLRHEQLCLAQNPGEFNEALLRPVPHSNGLIECYFEMALSVKFQRAMIQRYRNRRRKHSIGDFDAEDKLLMFQRPLPQLSKPSTFMNDALWATLWGWVPPRYRLLNLDLVYSTTEHGRHLLNVYSRCSDTEPLLLILETISGRIVGAYLSKALTTEHGHRFYGSGETFLFSLQPSTAKWSWNIQSESMAFTCATDAFLAFGTGVADFGLWIDKYVSKVTSSRTTTFANDPLLDRNNPDDLRIYALEIFRFI